MLKYMYMRHKVENKNHRNWKKDKQKMHLKVRFFCNWLLWQWVNSRELMSNGFYETCEQFPFLLEWKNNWRGIIE